VRNSIPGERLEKRNLVIRTFTDPIDCVERKDSGKFVDVTGSRACCGFGGGIGSGVPFSRDKGECRTGERRSEREREIPPKRIPVMVPRARKGGPMSQAPSPKRKYRASRICTRLLERAPITLIPIKERKRAGRKERIVMVIPLARDPAVENTKIYENSVPFTKACPRIFNPTRERINRGDSFRRARRMGRFASPNLKKGTGLGMRNSMVERNRQKAP